MCFESLLRQVIPLFSNVQTGSWAHPASYSVGTVFSTRVKAAGTWFDHSPPCTTEVHAWSYISTLPICLHGVDRGNITWVLLLYNITWVLLLYDGCWIS